MVNHLSLRSPYGYTPEKEPGIAYLVVFAIPTLIHVFLAWRYKYWVVFVTLVPGGVLEVVGWAGRLWSAYKVLKVSPFLMQIICLILGPVFFSAWAYTTLSYCITSLNPLYSLLAPRMYLFVFVIADIISLVLQAIGGGGAAVAAQNGTDTKKSTKIMLAGILFQLITMTAFVALALDFIVRVVLQKPYRRNVGFSFLNSKQTPLSRDGSVGEGQSDLDNSADAAYAETPNDNAEKFARDSPQPVATDSQSLRRAEYLLAGVAFASLMIYIRGIYRAIELAQGWTGYLITHEVYFVWLDGFPMVLCLWVFVFAHPGWLLPSRRGWKSA